MALFTTILLLVYFVFCERGWLSAWQVNFGHTRSWLLASSLGFALNVVLILTLNQAGLPVADFARPLAAGLLLLSTCLIFRRRNWRLLGVAPFAILAAAALAIGAWPMLRFDYNWGSFGNDDMTNYCLAAERVLHSGFYQVPDLSELSGSDFSQFYWFILPQSSSSLSNEINFVVSLKIQQPY